MNLSISRVVITGREQAEMQTEPWPESPLNPDEIEGRTVVSLVSAGTEIAGTYNADISFPAYPGYAAVFEVSRVGQDVQDVKPGDLAFCMGPHQSRQRVRRSEVVLVPKGLSAEQAVCARMIGIGMTTLNTTTCRPPDTVIVCGLGPVGNFAAQLFHLCGYNVLGIDLVATRRELALNVGIPAVAGEMPGPGQEMYGKVGLVLDCTGHEQAVLDACRVVRKKGEVVLVGVPWERRTSIFAHDLLDAVFHNYVILRSGWEWELPLHPEDFRTGSIMEHFKAALDWLATGRLKTHGLYRRRSPAEAQACYKDLLHGQSDYLLTLFDWCSH